MSWSVACDINGLAGIVFSGLSSLVIEDVADQNGVIVVGASTAGGPVPCPRCGAGTGRVHGYRLELLGCDARPTADDRFSLLYRPDAALSVSR